MRYSGYYRCRECGKTWRHKSNWVPFELVDWWYSILYLFHIIFKHINILKFKHIAKGLRDVFLKFLVAVLWIVATILRIVFYPFKLLVELLY